MISGRGQFSIRQLLLVTMVAAGGLSLMKSVNLREYSLLTLWLSFGILGSLSVVLQMATAWLVLGWGKVIIRLGVLVILSISSAILLALTSIPGSILIDCCILHSEQMLLTAIPLLGVRIAGYRLVPVQKNTDSTTVNDDNQTSEASS